MKKALLLSSLALCGTTAGAAATAAEYGTVIHRTAVYGQVAVPDSQCVSQPVAVQQPTTGGGALVGALVGGGLGNAVGGGAGRAAATAMGALAGAVVGNNVEAGSTPPAVANMQQCQTVTRYENRLVGYDVVYEYNGQRYSARVQSDPGDRIALQVDVAPVDAVPPPPPDMPMGAAPAPAVTYAGPAVVYAPAPWVYAPPVYWGPPVGLSIGLGWGHYRRWH